MRATLTAGSLRALLAPAAYVIGKHVTIPVLSFAKLEMSGDTLKITAQDLDAVYSSKVAATGDKGAVLVPLRAIYKIIQATPREEWVTITSHKDRILIEMRDARFSLITMEASKFDDVMPSFSLETPSPLLSMPEGWLRAQLGKVASFISTEDTRYYLNGVCLHEHQGGLALVATDGHRLARVFCDINAAVLGNKRIIIPRHAVNFLIDNCSTKAPATFSFLGENKSAVRVVCGDMTYSTKLIDGTFPDYERIIPRDEPCLTLSTNAGKLQATLSRLSFGGCLTLAMKDGRLVAGSSDADYGQAVIAVPGAVEINPRGDALKNISMNSKLIALLCRSAGSANVKISFYHRESPVLMEPLESRDIYILMPMRGGESVLDLPREAVAIAA